MSHGIKKAGERATSKSNYDDNSDGDGFHLYPAFLFISSVRLWTVHNIKPKNKNIIKIKAKVNINIIRIKTKGWNKIGIKDFWLCFVTFLHLHCNIMGWWWYPFSHLLGENIQKGNMWKWNETSLKLKNVKLGEIRSELGLSSFSGLWKLHNSTVITIGFPLGICYKSLFLYKHIVSIYLFFTKKWKV